MDTYADLDEGLHALKDAVPTLGGDGAPLVPFLPLLGIAMTAVRAVQTATHDTLEDAVRTVAQHLTPGQPDTSALTQAAPASAPVTDSKALIAAAAKAVAAPTQEEAIEAATEAVNRLPGDEGKAEDHEDDQAQMRS